MPTKFTPKQGQYLAFIYYYTKLNNQPPAERDFQTYFQATPPSVHDMILRLEEKGFISRIPGKARSIQLLIDESELPDLH
jgi:DNA-binding MarR family transcriptional regulator